MTITGCMDSALADLTPTAPLSPMVITPGFLSTPLTALTPAAPLAPLLIIAIVTSLCRLQIVTAAYPGRPPGNGIVSGYRLPGAALIGAAAWLGPGAAVHWPPLAHVMDV